MVPLLLAMASLAEEPAPEAASAPQTWAGHQVTVAVRHVPLLGDIQTRQDVYVVGQATDGPDGVTIVETACRIDLKSTAGLQLVFAPEAVSRLPKPTIAWKPSDDGTLKASWTNGWGRDDVDGDGEPGFLVGVKASVCSGQLEIASNTSFTGTATRVGGGLDGKVHLTIDREILKASNACLAFVPKGSKDEVDGVFSWRPVADGATCESVAAAGAWPATASP